MIFQEINVVEDELDFPDIPELVDIPETIGYSLDLSEDMKTRLDEFLMKREDWKRKWEHLTEEKRTVLENYIEQRLA